jgi:hypothetical protein
MFQWLWRRLGDIGPETSDYDAVYGFPKKAVAAWLQWNPQLEAEHQALERLAQHRRDKMLGKLDTR